MPRFILAILAFALGASVATSARAQGSPPCDAFVKNEDGSWSATRRVSISAAGGAINLREGSNLRLGAPIRSLDIAAMLDKECPAVTMAPSAAPTAPALGSAPGPAAPAPQAALVNQADANGFIDAQKFTCGQLVQTPEQDAILLLAWYSGGYSGGGKKRPIHVSQVKQNIRNVLAYCYVNKDKRMAEVMDLYWR
jgi:hypothetical protein